MNRDCLKRRTHKCYQIFQPYTWLISTQLSEINNFEAIQGYLAKKKLIPMVRNEFRKQKGIPLTKPAMYLKIRGRKMVLPYPLYNVSTISSATVSTCKRGKKKWDWFVSPRKRGVLVKLRTASEVRTLGAL